MVEAKRRVAWMPIALIAFMHVLRSTRESLSMKGSLLAYVSAGLGFLGWISQDLAGLRS